MINDRNIIHEGVIKDIVDLLTDNSVIKRNKLLNTKQTYFSSISKATSNLVLTFPVLVDDSVPLTTASLIAKAVEHKMVTMLQMLFSAIDITNNKDAFAFVGKVHKNLTSDDLISFINKMDAIPLKSKNESTAELDIDAINQYMIECMQYDDVYLPIGFKNSLNETYSVYGTQVFKEERGEIFDSDLAKQLNKWAKKNPQASGYASNKNGKNKKGKGKNNTDDEDKSSAPHMSGNKKKNNNKTDDDIPHMGKSADKKGKALKKWYKEQEKNRLYDRKDLSDMVISSDVKKVNEEVPSLMIVKFRTKDGNSTSRSTVIGVKAKIIYVSQNDVIDRIITKNNDNNGLFNFLRATTGEISMIKDFVFAVDKAKIDAISSRPDSSPIWKMLERRYLMNKKNWLMSSYNGSGTAIAVLLISKETADRLETDFGFKCEPHKLLSVMEAYSIMGFIIADDVKERVLSLYDDNSTNFEVLSYSAYEKEDKMQYKKIINLITGSKE